jgi:hypothetical protein
VNTFLKELRKMLKQQALQSENEDCNNDDEDTVRCGKVILLHAMEAHGVRGSIAPTHS